MTSFTPRGAQPRDSGPPISPAKAHMGRLNGVALAVLFLSVIALYGCNDLMPQDTRSLMVPSLQRSELVGFVAGLGTTFAALPDLVTMLKRRSSAGMNPRMAAIMGVFQILWIYYGLLIASRPVIVWNLLAVLINFVSVGAYRYFIRREKAELGTDHSQKQQRLNQ